MQKLRLVIIILLLQKKDPTIFIEIEEDSQRKSPGPFIRNKSALVDLSYRVSNFEKIILSYLDLWGINTPPFELPPAILNVGELINCLKKSNRIFIQQGKFGSLRLANSSQIAKYLNTPGNDPNPEIGKLLKGFIFIEDPGKSILDCRVKFQYKDVIHPVPAWTPIKILPSLQGGYICRNLIEESEQYKDLSGFDIDEFASIKLEAEDIDRILTLPSERWKVLCASDGKNVGTVNFSSGTGIDWFNDNDKNVLQDKNQLDLILSAYLTGRHYIEIGSQIFFFRHSDFNKNTKIVAQSLTKDLSDYSLITQIHENSNYKKNCTTVISKLKKSKFIGELRPYQLDGVCWLYNLRLNKFGGLLADEMGLGKTVQTLAYLSIIEEEPLQIILIVAPASVVPNWVVEFSKYAPSLNEKISLKTEDISEKTRFLIISYEKVRLSFEKLKEITFDTIILDEGQKVKNEHTQISLILKKLNSNHRIILTGTPIENSLKELWNHASFLNPALRGTYNHLLRNFPDFKDNPKSVELSSKLLHPVILQRKKSEVLRQLPEKIVRDIYFPLSEEERSLYDRILGMYQNALKRGTAARIPSIALEGLLRLRQCCSYPAMLPDTLNSGDIKKSTKLFKCIDVIKVAVKSRQKTIVFSQFTAVLDALEDEIDKLHIGKVRLDGSTRERQKVIDEFQNNANTKVFLIALKAGGFGINLTAAENVILFDPWWNPAVEEQAFSRAHRIGQTKIVFIYRLIAQDTVEEKMDQLREQKKELFAALDTNSKKITLDDLKNFFS
jgi:SNF2 family DNA or RNA helicase